MKFNPYPVLLTTGVLMFAIVLAVQTRTSVGLIRTGAVSVNRDILRLANNAVASIQGAKVAADDRNRNPGDLRDLELRPTRVAFLESRPARE